LQQQQQHLLCFVVDLSWFFQKKLFSMVFEKSPERKSCSFYQRIHNENQAPEKQCKFLQKSTGHRFHIEQPKDI
jgi:hypothetical protein